MVGTLSPLLEVEDQKPTETKAPPLDIHADSHQITSTARLSLPFISSANFLYLGSSLIHVVPCSTDWDCKDCANSREELEAIKEELHRRVNKKLFNSNVKIRYNLDASNPNEAWVTEDASLAVNSTAGNSQKTDGNRRRIGQGSRLSLEHRDGPKNQDGYDEDADGDGKNEDGLSSRDKSLSSKNKSDARGMFFGQKRNKSDSQELLSENFTLRMFGDWDQIKQQATSILLEHHPDVQRMFDLYVATKRVRMTSVEMSNQCVDSQHIMDSLIAQLYAIATDACRELIKAAKQYDADFRKLSEFVAALQLMRTQLQQFNLYDKDEIIKKSEVKLKERTKKVISVAAKAKNRELLTEIIMLLKTASFVSSNELLEMARRQLHGLQYDDFMNRKHRKRGDTNDPRKAIASNRVRQGQGRKKLRNLVKGLSEKLDAAPVILPKHLVQLIVTIDECTERDGLDDMDAEVVDGLELYFKIVRGIIRQSLQGSQQDSCSINHLRKILKSNGRSIPLRQKVLEICQLLERFQSTIGKASKHTDGDSDDEQDQAVMESKVALEMVTKDLIKLANNPTCKSK